MSFTAPARDIQFVLDHIVNFSAVEETGSFEDLSSDLVEAIIAEAGKLAVDVLAPLNEIGDKQGARLENGHVITTPGFKEAYQQIIEAGWNAMPFDPDYGGQGLPHSLCFACNEMFYGANMSLTLSTMLNAGATEAVSAHGTEQQKALYLPKLISGEWTGTMNLTEPHAGSDVGALRSKAERQEDGSYRIRGTKIFITYGDHDMTDNIIHLVLARLPDAPAGTRGISLFIVPKYFVNDDGSLGPRNDVTTVGLEHKLGIHGSPTCTLSFGENDGAIGYLLGAENKGMAAMFTMMNTERLGVGVQGIAMAERAYQKALEFAQERRQGKPFGKQHEQADMVPIIQHADVRRMLLTMKAYVEAGRAICLANAVAVDIARHHPNEENRARAKEREELLTPISKALGSDIGVECASIGLQVHGGMGFVEETGAAQLYRDVRITPIYEGTNGIQAIDLATRKLSMGGGQVTKDLLAEIKETADQLASHENELLSSMSGRLQEAHECVSATVEWMIEALKEDPQSVLAGASPYLRLLGVVAGAHYLGLGALAAQKLVTEDNADTDFYHGKISLTDFYFRNILPQSLGLAQAVKGGADSLFALSPDQMMPQ